MRIMKNLILRAIFLNLKGGRHIGSHEFFFQLCTAQQKQKRGGRSCFEEAQDSFGLEANHRRSPQRDNSFAPEKERERETDKQ